MVTARFLVGTKADDAILRVHEKIRANLDRIPVGIPEPLDRRPRHQRRRSHGADAVAEAGSRGALDRQGPVRACREAARELMKVDNVGLSYIVRQAPRSRSGSSPIRRSCRCSASRCSSSSPRCSDANRSFLAGQVRDAGMMRNVAAGQTLRAFPTSACCSSRPATAGRSMSGTSPPWSSARAPSSTGSGTIRADGKGQWARAPAVSLALAKRAGAKRWSSRRTSPQRLELLEVAPDPDRHPGQR